MPWVAPPQTALLNQVDLLDWQAYASRNTRVINALGMAAITLPLQAHLPLGLQLPGSPEGEAALRPAAVVWAPGSP